MTRSLIRGAAGFGLALALLAAAGCADRTPSVSIDQGQRFQTMRGWEVNAELVGTDGRPDLIPLYKDEIIARAVDEVGVNRLRLEVRSGAENIDRNWQRMVNKEFSEDDWRPLRYATVNDNDDPRAINWAGFDFSELDSLIDGIVLPVRRRLADRGERLTINLCYVAFTYQLEAGGAYHHADPEEYAEFVLATYLHMQDKYGFTPDMWEVLLEPDNKNRYWSPELMGRAIVASAKRLREYGFTPAFVAPSTLDMAKAPQWIDAIAKTSPEAINDIVEISYHRYAKSSTGNAKKIAETGERYGKPTSMLEWWFGHGNHKVLHEDLTVANAAAWQGQVLRTLFDVDISNPSSPRVSVAGDSRLNMVYFRSVRMGAERVGATSSDPGNTRAAAFINTDNSLVIVLDADAPATVSLSGLTPGPYRVEYSLASGRAVAATTIEADSGGAAKVRIPERGLASLVSKPPAE